MKVLMAEVNISEGKNQELISAIEQMLAAQDGLTIMEVNADANHNRTVYTYKGAPETVLAATKQLAKMAIEKIDMTKHSGSHPRMGAVDVVPFIPVKNITTEEAVTIAKQFGEYLAELGVPVYLYEDAQPDPKRKSLVKIRSGQYEKLSEKMQQPEWKPDLGPEQFNAKSGATVTGSRFPLVAFNINLATDDLEIGKKIVKTVRGATGGFQHVRAIALEIEEKNLVQVSMNLTNYEKTPIHRVFETIKSELTRYNVQIVDTELVGPVPIYALEELLQFYIKLSTDFSLEQIYD